MKEYTIRQYNSTSAGALKGYPNGYADFHFRVTPEIYHEVDRILNELCDCVNWFTQSKAEGGRHETGEKD